MYPQQGYSNNNYSYNAAQAFSSAYGFGTVSRMASYNNVIMSASTPGLPEDTFHRTRSFSSSRFMQPINETAKFMKELGGMISSVGWIAKIVGYFYPPAAAVGAVAEIAAPVLTTFAGDTTPKPVVFTTQQRYNPWIR